MARQFDGTNDRLQSPADSVANIANDGLTLCSWVYVSGTQVDQDLLLSTGSATNNIRRTIYAVAPAVSGVRYSHRQQTNSTSALWETPDQTAGVWHSVVVSRDRSQALSVAPSMWVDGQSVTPTVATSGSGTQQAGDDNVFLGENGTGANDFTGSLGPAALIDGTSAGAAANRFHWWGCAPGGPSTMAMWLPLWTDDLRNKGTGGDHAYTATGTTMTAMPKVERCWAASMGVGR